MMTWFLNSHEKEEQSPRGRGELSHPPCVPSRSSRVGCSWLVVSALMFLAINNNDNFNKSSWCLSVLISERIQDLLHCVRHNRQMLISTCLHMRELLLLGFYDASSADIQKSGWRQIGHQVRSAWKDGKYLTWCWWGGFQSWLSVFIKRIMAEVVGVFEPCQVFFQWLLCFDCSFVWSS